MKRRFITMCALVGLVPFVFANIANAQATKAKGAGASDVEQAIAQMEKDWAQAGQKKDTATLDRILADDWVGIDFNGKTVSKTQAISDLKSGAATLTTFEMGPLKIRVYGNTAIVNGSDTEKSSYQGKDSSGSFVWTDVFVNRNGKWQAVNSQSLKTK